MTRPKPPSVRAVNWDDAINDLYAAYLALLAWPGRDFELYRETDVSGVSGVGVVAVGKQFIGGTADGLVVLRWRPPYESTVVWPSLDLLLGAHGHSGKTVVRWLDEEDA